MGHPEDAAPPGGDDGQPREGAGSRRRARLITWSSALLWGLQFAFLTPVLALLLVAVYGASPADVGWVLAIYNGGGFLASLIIPAWADRSGNYLRPMLICAGLTLALALVLMATTALPGAVIALIVLGGPASVGSTLLFAHLRSSGAGVEAVMNTRALFSFAWVAGPPLATFVMGALGDWAILPFLAVVGALNAATTILLIRRRHSPGAGPSAPAPADAERSRVRIGVVLAVVAAFVLLQATNATAMSVMTLHVTATLDLPVVWGGIVLGVAALLEIPALWGMGRLSRRFSVRALLLSGCLAGIVYYAALAVASGPAALLAIQLLNAWFFAVVGGLGMTVFQSLIQRPGLATGLYMNTRRIGAIVSGPIIAVAAIEPLGYPAVFAVCALLTVVATIVLASLRGMREAEAA